MLNFKQAELNAIEQELIEIRRRLHTNPELSHEEFLTTEIIRDCLSKKAINIRRTNLKTGICADIGVASKGPTVAIRADMDALPIEERTGLPYSSQNPGIMHACGHDLHMASAIGAAYLLKNNENLLPGRVRLIFQPSEETDDGAKLIIEDGQLDGVSAIIGLHNKPGLPVGTVGLKKDALMAAVDRFHIILRGKGGHAALPHKTHDPILAASQLVSALQSIISRNVPPVETAVVSVTRINGGSTWNVIPGEVALEGTIRSFSPELRKQVKQRFYTIVEHISAAFEQNAVITWLKGPPPVRNDSSLTEIVMANTARFLNVVTPEVSAGGEDFSYYQELIPGLFAFLGVGGKEEWHHPEFTIDESAIILGAHFLASNTCAMLEHFGRGMGL